MDTNRQNWKRAPVIEVVLGVQFDALPALTNGHLGWFWGEMHDEFPFSNDAPPLQINNEEFGDRVRFGFPALGLSHATGDSRLRMMNSDKTKMIQIQNGWLIVNWTKQVSGEYPGFGGIKVMFDTAFSRFSKFLSNRNIGVLKPNMWEITYIDHIPAGTVWEKLTDVPSVFPGLLGRGECTTGISESIATEWTWRLSPKPSRLQLSIHSGRTLSSTKQELDVLLVRTIARGPLGSDCDKNILDDALSFGRSSVVDTFMGVVSDEAKRYWRGE